MLSSFLDTLRHFSLYSTTKKGVPITSLEAMSSRPYFSKLSSLIKENQRITVIVILILAFLWRLIYFLEILDSPYGNNLAMDSLVHHEWAAKIASGKWLHDEAFFRAPLYPYFLGGIYFLFDNSQTAAKLIQILLGCGSCLLIYYIAKKTFNEAAALTSLIISSFYGMYLYFENELLIVSLIVFLDLLGVLLLLIAAESSKFLHWFLSGLFLGLSAIARPNILLFVLFLPLWIYFTFRTKATLQHISKFTVALGLGCIIPILPIVMHNYVIGNDFVLIGSQGGVNFYIGNNPQSDGRTAIVPGTRDTWWGGTEDQINMAKRGLGNPNAKASEISRYWYNRGLDFILNNPSDSLKLILKKLYMFWNAHEFGNNRGIRFVTRYSSIFTYFTFKFWLICPLAFAGIYLSLRRKLQVSLPLLFIFSYMVSIIIFFVTSRYRIPVIPLLIIFASYALTQWLTTIGDKHFLKALICNPALRNSAIIFATTGLIIQPVTISKGNEAQGFFNEGEAYRMKNDFSNAIKCYEKAKSANPHYLSAYINMANVYMDALSDYEKAEKIFEEALEIAPGSPEVLYNMGVLYLKLKQKAKAREYFLTTLEANRNHANAHIQLGYIHEMESDYEKALSEYSQALSSRPHTYTLYGRIGNMNTKLNRFPEAREAFKRALEINPNFAGAYINIGETYLRQGDFKKAIACYKNAIQINPGDAVAYNNIGFALMKMGKWEDAIIYYDKAIEYEPTFFMALKNKADLLLSVGRYHEAINHYRTVLRFYPNSVKTYYRLAISYEKLDILDKAASYYSKALELDPNLTSARNNLNRVLTKAGGREPPGAVVGD